MRIKTTHRTLYVSTCDDCPLVFYNRDVCNWDSLPDIENLPPPQDCPLRGGQVTIALDEEEISP